MSWFTRNKSSLPTLGFRFIFLFSFFQLSEHSRVESEQRHIEDRANASQLSTLDKQDDRHLLEARQDKLRYLEEVHSAQRKMNDLQAHLKLLETKLADKDVEIRLLQEKKSTFRFLSFPKISFWLTIDIYVSFVHWLI